MKWRLLKTVLLATAVGHVVTAATGIAPWPLPVSVGFASAAALSLTAVAAAQDATHRRRHTNQNQPDSSPRSTATAGAERWLRYALIARPTDATVVPLDDLRQTLDNADGAGRPSTIDERALVRLYLADGRVVHPWSLCWDCDNDATALVRDPNDDFWVSFCAEHAPHTVVPPVPHRLITIDPDDKSPHALAVGKLTDAVLTAWVACEQSGSANVPDLVSAALTTAAELLGGSDALIWHRPGSWEATHVQALAALADHGSTR